MYVRHEASNVYLPLAPFHRCLDEAWAAHGDVLAKVQHSSAWKAGKLEAQATQMERRLGLKIPEGQTLNQDELRELQAILGDSIEIHVSNVSHVDLLQAGQNKGSALTSLLKLAGLDPGTIGERILVFGDTGNDLAMSDIPGVRRSAMRAPNSDRASTGTCDSTFRSGRARGASSIPWCILLLETKRFREATDHRGPHEGVDGRIIGELRKFPQPRVFLHRPKSFRRCDREPTPPDAFRMVGHITFL